MLGNLGVTYWLPIASAANIAQGGACLAVALKTKNEKTKALAVPSGISCLLGITEPAIFGVNLPKLKPFIAGMIGSAVGAFVCSVTQLGATGTGVTGLFGILLCINQPIQYCIMFAAAFGVAFAITYAIYTEDAPAAPAAKQGAGAKGLPSSVAATAEANTLCAPMTGKAVAMTSVSDPVFASEAMGKGVAIEPTEGGVYAPVSGQVTMVAGSGHAVGLMSDDGCEVLIHIGIDTVELNGAPFKVHVAAGDSVKAGAILVEADLAKIKDAGKPATTMLIVTNTDDYAKVEPTLGAVTAGSPVVRLTK